MARLSLKDAMEQPSTVDRAKLAATTEEDIARYQREDGYDPDAAVVEPWSIVLPPHEVDALYGIDPKLDTAASDIARAIAGFVVPFRAAPKHMQDYYATALKWAVRHTEMFITPLVSRAAQEKAAAFGLGDMRRYRWRNRPRVKENGKDVFHWEHAQTVGHMSRLLTALETPTLTEIEAVVRTAEIVWILKTEDQKLNELGYNDRRPDWRSAYAHAGIEVLPRHD